MNERDRRSDPAQPTLLQRRSARPRSSPPHSETRERTRPADRSAAGNSGADDAFYDRTIAQAVAARGNCAK
jgi:hypothetical protein